MRMIIVDFEAFRRSRNEKPTTDAFIVGADAFCCVRATRDAEKGRKMKSTQVQVVLLLVSSNLKLRILPEWCNDVNDVIWLKSVASKTEDI